MNYRALLALTLFPLLLGSVAQAENPDHVKKLLKSGRCSKCDLTGADLAAANLRKANLQGADLTNANLNLADLTGANLSDANLTGASLVFVDFTGATLNGAQLTDAVIEGGDQFGRAGSFDKATLPNGIEARP
ncbi:Secreted effector protein PipB [Acaryochloris thomasi RCC1774]|uniref:Secreted effector protein PipB n=2 Tax=Acaryochloris TaxID=155977 RepID=A0A2W1JNF9_9CYAN|nr:Secreted effector protein PipB [Acaryochloris thomasi RCC1774]